MDIQKLINDAGRADAVAALMQDVNPHAVLELAEIKAAAEKLVRCKGRYHAEQNYRALAALFGVTTPDIEPAAPPVRDLAALVPDEISPENAQAASSFTVYEMSRPELLVATEMWNACRAEMLRRIEEMKKC